MLAKRSWHGVSETLHSPSPSLANSKKFVVLTMLQTCVLLFVMLAITLSSN